ncbi:MAG: TetR/AcrR family transcriptional regulator [Sphingobacteriales bacterium]|nr:MAG: TetR/AcrR family transcriptional regulator [Sphingobacteriales bacterium]
MKTKAQILQKALLLFNEKGYINVGVREIARDLDISPGNLSYHFGKKEDILIALLNQFRDANSSLYEEYFEKDATLSHFLQLMKSIFESQYQYRGVFIGNQYIQSELKSADSFNYKETYNNRVAGFTRIFKTLIEAGQIQSTDEDIAFLVSLLTLIGRFWIQEATLFNHSPDKETTILYYITLLSKQLSLFATQTGLDSIEQFKNNTGN